MPYSPLGACEEHVTNVSANEIPSIATSLQHWVKHAPATLLKQYNINPENFNEYKVLPRLFFGEYLSAQFELLKKIAKDAGIVTQLFLNCRVTDAKDDAANNQVIVFCEDGDEHSFDQVIISTGHRWPKQQEGKITGWFDSPYPPAKLAGVHNYPVAIKGASLTAIDAIKTLARGNGTFTSTDEGLQYQLNEGSQHFRLVLHSLKGLMPAVRFHLEDTQLNQGHSFTEQEISAIKEANGGFVPLDVVFEKNFKQPLQQGQPEFYEQIKDMNMEAFVDHVMSLREKLDAITLFKAEYKEAEKSIKRKESVYWKEMLAVLSYEMNYPAKHFSAEDMMRLKKKLMPLISIIIAFVPQSSADELIALHDAGVLSLQPVDENSTVEPLPEGGCLYSFTDEDGNKIAKKYQLFVNAVGQCAFMKDDFIFKSMVQDETVSEAHIKFKDAAIAQAEIENNNKNVVETAPGEYWLKVPGININDNFQVLDKFGQYNSRIHIMAVPYIAGLNPDYSGLDFCERASNIIAKQITEPTANPKAA